MRSPHCRPYLLLVVVLCAVGIISPFLSHQTPQVQAQSATRPILLVVNDQTPQLFGRYLGEILRAEGLNSFEIVPLANLQASHFTNRDVTILAQSSLTGVQATLFQDYVNGGGRLIAMRPDAQIHSHFGLGAPAGTLTDPYIRINNSVVLNGSQPGAGLPSDTLQIHGQNAAERYALLPGAIALADLYLDATQASSSAAVVSGSNGRAIAFTYNLAHNIVYTRQGNPANADVDVDGDGVLRTIDLFQGQGAQAPWVDRTKIPLPQADIQQRFFARLVRQLAGEARPLPQLWYFPGQTKTVLVLTSDGHGNATSSYQTLLNRVNAYNGKVTFYLSLAGEPSRTTVQNWRAAGHGVGIHPYWWAPNEGYPPYNITNLAQGYSVYNNWWDSQYSGVPRSPTVRNHQVAWLGWTGAATIAVNSGYTLDTNFYHWGPWTRLPDGTWPHGYITGSGQPMKFITADGAILNIYQQLTQLVDEQLVAASHYEGLNATQAIAVSRQLIDASQAGDYAAIMTQFHVDYWGQGPAANWGEGTMSHASSLNIPLLSADQWLSFTQTRHDAEFTSIAWNESTNQLTFNLQATANSNSLSVLVPLTYANRTLQSISVDGGTAGYQNFTVSGQQLALVSVTAGNRSFTVNYTGSPGQTATPTAQPSPVPTNTPTPVVTPTSTMTPLPVSWTHVPGQCAQSLSGAVFAIVGTGCGGSATTFDSFQIYAPGILRDVASAEAPCSGIAPGATCYRMWYTGDPSANQPRIGYAVSPNGITWTRIAGPGPGGSVLGPNTSNTFESGGAAYASVIKDGSTYKMWYVGYNAGTAYVAGIGYATSSDGLNWQRVAGPLASGAVLLPTGQTGIFDRDTVNTPNVIKDRATSLMPCAGVATGEVCYRMWYEGATFVPAYRFKIGYATSPDGLTWTRVWDPNSSDRSVLDIASSAGFDENSVGVPSVIKEGAVLHMWYEAKDFQDNFRLGQVTSSNGIHWVRPTPNQAIWTGANDPGVFNPDNVWTPMVLKELAQYRLWYSYTTQYSSQRIGLATAAQGIPLQALNLTGDGTNFTLTFNTTSALANGSSVLLTFPAHVALIGASNLNLSGFGGTATIAVDPSAITDAESYRSARAAILIHLPNGASVGGKSVSFQLPQAVTTPGQLVVQSFNGHRVAQYGVISLPLSGSGGTSTPTATPIPTNTAGPSPTPTMAFTPTPTNTPGPAATNTPVPPTATPTPTNTAGPTATNTPVPPTATPTNTAGPTPTPTATIPSAGFPSTSVLDSFTRANGAIGNNWSGSAGSYRIFGNQLDVISGGDLYWQANSFGANQEAFVTFSTIDPNGAEHDLILKAQGSSHWTSGLIIVVYEAPAQRVQVWTFANGQGWVQHGANIPVTFVNGDRFGARATANGNVEVYRNGSLLATRSVATWPFAANGGYIGLWYASAPNAFLDDFGGGSLSAAATPTATNTPGPTTTNTPVPPTATNTPGSTATNTPVPPTATNTPGSTATNTPVPPTATNTPGPTATNTPVPPTATPTNTPGSTATNTPVPPTATPTNTAGPTPTPTATIPSAGFPSTSVLDSFTRANGAIGNNWSGSAGSYRIFGNQLDVISGGDLYWQANSFGANQEAFVTFSTIDPNGAEHDLILKAQGSSHWTSGLIIVVYEAPAQRVQVWTFANGQGWVQHGANIPVTFVNGDRFGARATANGNVEVYRNGSLLATRSVATWSFAANGGYIGLWYASAPNAFLDDFGGGSLSAGVAQIVGETELKLFLPTMNRDYGGGSISGGVAEMDGETELKLLLPTISR